MAARYVQAQQLRNAFHSKRCSCTYVCILICVCMHLSHDGVFALQANDYHRLKILGDALLPYLVTAQLFLHEEEYGGSHCNTNHLP